MAKNFRVKKVREKNLSNNFVIIRLDVVHTRLKCLNYTQKAVFKGCVEKRARNVRNKVCYRLFFLVFSGYFYLR